MAKADPLYLQVTNDLRAKINTGELSPGEAIPSEHELMEQHQVSRHTVQKALSLLTSEGLITAGQGRRREVRRREPAAWRPQEELLSRPRNPEMDQFLERFSNENRTPHQDIGISVLVPPLAIARRLGLEPEDLTIVRRRVRYLDGEASHINDTYFPHSLVKDTEIADPRDLAQGTLRVLRDMGYRQDHILDEIWVRMPTSDENGRLSLPPGTPVAEHVRTGYTAKGLPIRCAVSILPGDRHVIAMEFNMPEDWS
ncbi:GntR family transcriptional regulator [Halostreptopolyspora alba]|uniref:GntR family transcriptional regulator n=1 Tax=Halostreptopolyspora alba TaxID=2487137 RepID=A0A3N0E6T5_9ACTN|nr:GntR family transcriptional regulator [Nocardiopsaceae bacterium YIM 96095]